MAVGGVEWVWGVRCEKVILLIFSPCTSRTTQIIYLYSCMIPVTSRHPDPTTATEKLYENKILF